jgi:hypothetical protein
LFSEAASYDLLLNSILIKVIDLTEFISKAPSYDLLLDLVKLPVIALRLRSNQLISYLIYRPVMYHVYLAFDDRFASSADCVLVLVFYSVFSIICFTINRSIGFLDLIYRPAANAASLRTDGQCFHSLS